MNKEEKQIASKRVYQGRILDLFVDDVICPNGIESKREFVSHRGGAAILAIDKDENAYFVRQFRYPYREELLEIPAGKIEKDENPINTAKRELTEETGLISDDLEEYGVLYPTPGYTNEKLYVYKTVADEIGQTHLDSDEFIDVCKINIEKAFDMVVSGVIKDAKTVYAISRYIAEKYRK